MSNVYGIVAAHFILFVIAIVIGYMLSSYGVLGKAKSLVVG